MTFNAASHKTSQSPSQPGRLELVETKGSTTPSVDGNTGRSGLTGGGREVVVGITAPHHRVASRNRLLYATPMTALVAGAGLYAWASGLSIGDDDDSQQYAIGLRNGVIGAAGLVAGAVLPPLVAWGRHAWQSLTERKHLQQPGHDTHAYQLDRLVQHAVAGKPLTLAGLEACIARMHQVRTAGASPQQLAMAVARLAQAVPSESGACRHCGSDGPDQLDRLIDELQHLHGSGQISQPQFKQALVGLARHLAAPGPDEPAKARALADTLVSAYEPSAPAGVSAIDARLWDGADFMVALCGTPCFERHAQAVHAAVGQALGITPAACAKAVALAPQRALPDGKSEAPATAGPQVIQDFFKAYGSNTTCAGQASALDKLAVDLGRGAIHHLTQQDFFKLNGFLNFQASDQGLANARDRLQFVLNHWNHSKRAVDQDAIAGGKQASAVSALHEVQRELATMKVFDSKIWSDASLGALEALSHLAAASRGNETLRALADQATSVQRVGALLFHTPATRLKKDLAMAVGIAMNRSDNAVLQASYLVETVKVLQRRQDLPPGALLEGVLMPDAVESLLRRLPSAPVVEGVNPLALVAPLIGLSQLQATPDLLKTGTTTFRQLWQARAQGLDAKALAQQAHVLDNSIAALTGWANRRIVPPAQDGVMDPDMSLHLPWLADQARGVDTVITVRDFERTPAKSKG